MNHAARDIIAATVGPKRAERVLDALREAGLAVYRQRVTVNKRRKNRSTPMTEAVIAGIRRDYEKTDMTQHEIAAKWGVNPGRVNEIVH